MYRGIFDFIKNEKAYSDSKKKWYVVLDKNMFVWYDMIVSRYDFADTRKIIKDKIKSLKNSVKSNVDKRFIYYICSRKRVRFSLDHLPIIFNNNKKSRIFLEIGRENELHEIKIHIPWSDAGEIKSIEFLADGKFISFKYSRGPAFVFSVHEFLLEFSINLNLSSCIHYIGLTDNPERRPLFDGHQGFNEVLYNISNEDRDVLVYFNLFKVTVIAENSVSNFNFNIANSMIDEIDVEKEGSILEKCLIFYFDSDLQFRNRNTEKSDLENSLKEILNTNNISEIQINYEVDDSSDYYNFSSSKISKQSNHQFTCYLENGSLNIEKGSSIYEVQIKPYEEIIKSL